MLLYLLTFVENKDDHQNLTIIFEQYHVKMEKVAMRILPEQKDAEDAVQNAFIQVIKNFEKVMEIPKDELLYWLISVTKNEALMVQRKKRRTVPLEDWNAFTEMSNSNLYYQDIVALFVHMPETYRCVLEMKYLLEYSDKEIAQHLGISETAVSSRASRGRLLLQELIRKEAFRT